MRYLLDTNMVSDLVRHPDGLVTRRIQNAGQETVVTSIIVVAEIRYGVAKRGSRRLADQVDAVLEKLGILNVHSPVDRHYAQIRVQLESSGQPIGPNDLLIASQAIALDLTLVTDNVREFSRVDGLRVENWLRDPESP